VQAQTSDREQVKSPSLGTLANGLYHHNLTGIEFTLPTDWVVASQGPASQGAEFIKLRSSASNEIATVWMKRRNADAADLEPLMNGRLDDKIVQRNNFQGYKYRPESVQHANIGGRPALRAVADYVSAGRNMVECLTWVDGEKSRVVFVGRVPVSELTDFQARFEPVIASAIVP